MDPPHEQRQYLLKLLGVILASHSLDELSLRALAEYDSILMLPYLSLNFPQLKRLAAIEGVEKICLSAIEGEPLPATDGLEITLTYDVHVTPDLYKNITNSAETNPLVVRGYREGVYGRMDAAVHEYEDMKLIKLLFPQTKIEDPDDVYSLHLRFYSSSDAGKAV